MEKIFDKITPAPFEPSAHWSDGTWQPPVQLISGQSQWKPEYFSKVDPSASSFIYLGHGYIGFTKPDGQMASAIDLFEFLSNELLKKDNYTIRAIRSVYGKVGFILKVSEKSIIAAGPDDIGTIMEVSSAEFLKTYATMHFAMNGLPSPQDLLTNTRQENYNEVAILSPGATGHRIEVVGVVIHTDPNQPAGRVTVDNVKEFEELARMQNLEFLAPNGLKARQVRTFSIAPNRGATNISNPDVYA